MVVKLVITENIDHGRIGEVALGLMQSRRALMNVSGQNHHIGQRPWSLAITKLQMQITQNL